MARTARSRQNATGRALTGKKPGEVVILRPARTVFRKSGKEMIKTEWAVADSGALFVEVDARRYVREVQLALADHCGDSLARQVRPDTGAPLRDQDEVARNMELRRTFGSVKQNTDTLGMSGEMARKWYVGKVNGTPLRAQGIVRPTIDGQRLKWVNYYLGATTLVERRSGAEPVAIKRDRSVVDVQSTTGLAAKAIEDAVADLATRSMGSKVATPADVKTIATDRIKR